MREGVIHGYVSREIQNETVAARRDEPIIGNVFYDIALEQARVPVYRSRFIQGGWNATFGKPGLLWVCQQLLNLRQERVQELLGLSCFDEFERDSLRGLHVFHSICSGLDQRHFPDAYHLWTAERNGIDFYCMIEKRFRNALATIRRHHGLLLQCQVITPEELLSHMGVTERDPPPLREGWFYDRFGIGEPIEVLDAPTPGFGDRLRQLLRWAGGSG